VKLSRLAAAGGGVAGPVLFTVAWAVSSLCQAGYSAAEVQLSGLAAEDARDPQIMMAGFVVLGAGTAMLGAGLGHLTAPRPAGPRLVLLAGAASVAAGLFRRDHMLLAGPGFAGESWHSQVHDVVSGIATRPGPVRPPGPGWVHTKGTQIINTLLWPCSQGCRPSGGHMAGCGRAGPAGR